MMKSVNRLKGLVLSPPTKELLPLAPSADEAVLEQANKLCDPHLLEFALDLDAGQRLRLAANQERWAKQLRASAAVLKKHDKQN